MKALLAIFAQPWPYLTTFGRVVYMGGGVIAFAAATFIGLVLWRGFFSVLGGCS